MSCQSETQIAYEGWQCCADWSSSGGKSSGCTSGRYGKTAPGHMHRLYLCLGTWARVHRSRDVPGFSWPEAYNGHLNRVECGWWCRCRWLFGGLCGPSDVNTAQQSRCVDNFSTTLALSDCSPILHCIRQSIRTLSQCRRPRVSIPLPAALLPSRVHVA